MNCMNYALDFWQKNPNYLIYYNSDHAINLPIDTKISKNFLPLESFGYEHVLKSFELSENSKEILKLYFEK